MKRLILIGMIATGLLLPASASATPNVKYCGHSPSGIFTVSAGKKPPTYPRTSCAFARNAMKAVAFRIAKKGKLPTHFRIKVGQQKMKGSYVIFGSIQVITMRNKRRFVQVFAPY